MLWSLVTLLLQKSGVKRSDKWGFNYFSGEVVVKDLIFIP